MAQLRDAQRETDVRLNRLTNLTDRFVDASGVVMDNQNRLLSEIRTEQQQLTEAVEELRASNRCQDKDKRFFAEADDWQLSFSRLYLYKMVG